MKVKVDGDGMFSHAVAERLCELAGFTGPINAWDQALLWSYKAIALHLSGSEPANLAFAIAFCGDFISDLRTLRDQPVLLRAGGVPSRSPTPWFAG